MPVIRVMSWNVHGSAKPSPGAVADVIRSFTPDVVALQEVRARQSVSIARALGWSSPLWSFKHLPYGPLWWLAEGMAMLSPLPQEGGRAFAVSSGAHLFSFRRRIAQRLDIHAAGVVLRCWNVHLASQERNDGERRSQVERLLAIAEQSHIPRDDGREVIPVVLGDLNDGSDPSVRELLGTVGLRDAWAGAGRRVGRDDGFTSPATRPYQCLDHVLATGRLGIEDVVVPVDDGTIAGLSDHLPVIATLRLPVSAAEA